jgi:protein-L-isoaspartate(D-aspartate) O-methyltransferase
MTKSRIEILLNLNSTRRNELLISLSRQGISDKILRILNKIPREYFIDKEYFNESYHDKPLPIGNGQTISQPYTVCFMTELLEIENDSKVLEIGTGSGYQTLILKMLGCDVYTIERIEQLYLKSITTFKDFNVQINCVHKDGSVGLEEFAPFDRIIVTAAAPEIPETLKNQLSINGIMVIPVGEKDIQTMLKIKRIDNNNYQITEHSTFRFVPLIGKSGWKL